MSLIEKVGKRTEYGKSYDLDNKELVNVYSSPIHYFDDKEWKDIEVKLDLVLANKEYGSHYISDKHKWSYGFRNDKKLEKFYGIRKGYDNQLESTPEYIEINGSTVSIPNKFQDIRLISDTEIEHVLNEDNSLYTQIVKEGFRNALKTNDWVEDFKIIERLDLKGFVVTNPYVDNSGRREYTPYEDGTFVLRSLDGEELILYPAVMWNLTSSCNNGISHRLVEVSGELQYIKTPNQEGSNWLKLNRPPFYIDINLFNNSMCYMQAYDKSYWDNARNGLNASTASNSCIAGAWLTSGGYYCYHGFFYYDFRSYSGLAGNAYMYFTGGYDTNLHYINVYKASSVVWDTSTANYCGQFYVNSPSSTFYIAVSSDMIPLGSTAQYRLRDYNYDVLGTAPNAAFYSTFSSSYLSFTPIIPSAANAIWFGCNF